MSQTESQNASRTSISELIEGQKVEEIFLIREASMRETKTGKNYIAAQLGDASGSIVTRLWDARPRDIDTFKAGNFVRVRAHVESYQGKPQLVVEGFKPVDAAEVDSMAFMPTTPKDLDQMQEQLKELIKSVKDSHLLSLLESFFGDTEFLRRFSHSPAASAFHHAYVGGLLEHSLSVARLGASAAEEHPQELDRDLMVVGGLLHDLGKTYELSSGPVFDYTDAGRLIGHIIMGCLEAERRMLALSDFPVELKRQVLHLIASHHGQKEFGAPILPCTPEAFALHHCDNLDAKMRASFDAPPQSEGDQWSDYQRMLGVRVHKGSSKSKADATG
jgi:3'-5' exoribonuclease